MYTFEIKEVLEKSLRKLAKRDKLLYEAVMKRKIRVRSPHMTKNGKGDI